MIPNPEYTTPTAHSLRYLVRCELDNGHDGEHFANVIYYWKGGEG